MEELLHRGQRVACHARSERRGEFTTVTEHMPAAHRAHLQWTPQRLIDWGNSIGMATGAIVTRLLSANKHPEHGYREISSNVVDGRSVIRRRSAADAHELHL
jgi:hypothetical protein